MDALARLKADRQAVETALQVKADKDAVERESKANQEAVDAALNTMNAGTQGIQQLLESQGGVVSELQVSYPEQILSASA